MKKKLLSLFAISFMAFTISAQVVWSDDFESTTLTGYTVYDEDGYTTEQANYAAIASWVNYQIWNDETYAAIVTSWYGPGEQADDWLITPQVSIPVSQTTYVKFDALGNAAPNYPEVVEIWVSDATTAIADFDSLQSFTIDNATLANFGVDLSAYAGSDIYIGIRSRGVYGGILILDNLSVEKVESYDVALGAVSNYMYDFVDSADVVGFSYTNNGAEVVTSLEVSYTVNGTAMTETISGLNTAYGESEAIEIPITVAAEGIYAVSIEATGINGANADVATDDNTVTGQLVYQNSDNNATFVGEQATGTWCQWCPRGHVFSDQMQDDYPDTYIGIAAHTSAQTAADPMEVAEYAAGIGGYVGGYPSMVLNRIGETDPGNLPDFYNFITGLAAPATVTGTAEEDEFGTINISLTAQSVLALEGMDFTVSAIVVEDGVTGTGAGWDQVNAYSGGASGAMGGYESLANPVPAADMVYNHVARAVLGTFTGEALMSSPTAATDYTKTFTYAIPDDQDVANMRVAFLILDANGLVVGASQTDVVPHTLSGIESVLAKNGIRLLNNPSVGGVSFIELNLDEAMDIQVTVFDIMGKTVASRNYGQMNGKQQLPIITQNFATGTYFVNISSGAEKVVKKLIVR